MVTYILDEPHQGHLEGATIRYLGGAEFLPGHFYLFHMGDGKPFITSG